MNIKRISPGKGVTNEPAALLDQTARTLYWDYNGGNSFITTDPPVATITEDIDYEIVEPKQLPPNETKA